MQRRPSDTGSAGGKYGGPRELPPGYVLKDEYVIERTLGAGGFGITYLARHKELKSKQVAIKEYLPRDHATRDSDSNVNPASLKDKETFDWGRERFIEEANNIYRVSNPDNRHPNIVAIETVIPANNTAYMVMELVVGRTLEELLEDEAETFDEARLTAVLKPLLAAIESIHAENLIHRDIKPGNIVLRDDGSPVLIDFGSARGQVRELDAKVKGDDERSGLTAIVTPGYSPLEQEQSTTQDARTDIYALAATIYHAAFGKKPAAPATRQGCLREGKTDPLKSAKSLGSGQFSPEFLDAIDWGLALYREDRPETVAKWRKLLGIKDEPTARETESVSPNAKRNARFLLVGSALLAVIAAGFVAYQIVLQSRSNPDFDLAMERAKTTLAEGPTVKDQVVEAQGWFSRARGHQPQDETAAAGSDACDALLRFLDLLQIGQIDRASNQLEAAVIYLRVAQVDESVINRLNATMQTARYVRNARNFLLSTSLLDNALESATASLADAEALSPENAEVVALTQIVNYLIRAADALRENNFPAANEALSKAESRIEQSEAGSGKLTLARKEVSKSKTIWVAEKHQQTNQLLLRDPTDLESLSETRATYGEILITSPGDKMALAGVELVDALHQVLISDPADPSASMPSDELQKLASAAGLAAPDADVIIEAVRIHNLGRRRQRAVIAVAYEPMSSEARTNARGALTSMLEESKSLSIPGSEVEKLKNGLGVIAVLDGIDEEIRGLRFAEARRRAEALPSMLLAAELDAAIAEKVDAKLTASEHAYVSKMLEEAKHLLASNFPEGLSEAVTTYDRILGIDPESAAAKTGGALAEALVETRDCGLRNELDCAWTSLAKANAVANESELPAELTGPAEQWLQERTRTAIYRTLARTVDRLRLLEFSAAAFDSSRQQIAETTSVARLSGDRELEAVTVSVSEAIDHLQAAEEALRTADFDTAEQQSARARSALESQPAVSPSVTDAYMDHLRRRQSGRFRSINDEVGRTLQSAAAALTVQPLEENALTTANDAVASIIEHKDELKAAGYETGRIDAFVALFKVLAKAHELVTDRQFPAALDALNSVNLEQNVSPDVTGIVSSARAEVQQRQNAAVEAEISQAIAALRDAPLDADRQTVAQNAFEEVASIDPQRTDLASQGLGVVSILAEAGAALETGTKDNGVGRARAFLKPARDQASAQFGTFEAAMDILTLALLELDARQAQELDAARSVTLHALSSATLDTATLDTALKALRKTRYLERQIGRNGEDTFGSVGTRVVHLLKRARLGMENLYFAGAEKIISAAAEQARSLKGRAEETEIVEQAIARLRDELEATKPDRRDYMPRLSDGATLVMGSPGDPIALEEASSMIRFVLDNQQADLPMALALSEAVDELKLAIQAKQECRVEDALASLQNANTHFIEAGTPTYWIEGVEDEITKTCGAPP